MAIDVQYRGDNDDAGPSDGVWFDVDLQDHPKKLVEFFEDFVVGIPGGLTTAGSVAETLVADANWTRGGSILIKDTGGADGSIEGAHAFKHADDKDLTFEARVSLESLADTAGIIGLYKDGDEHISFSISAGSAQLVHSITGTSTNVGSAKAFTVDTYVKLGFRVRGLASSMEITAYADGVKLGSTSTSLTSVQEALAVRATSTHATSGMHVDWIRVAQVR